ncbi:MAG: class I SAM-dependent methyltransferase [Gammaproteobacteria bacterium]|nr:class I SAM-dependent methyltransferase [Gammaproteobacteria bacterium]
MSSRTLTLDENIYEYLLQNIRPESEAMRELREVTHATLRMHVMQVSPEQAAFMALLCRLMNAKKTIEVGTFTGYSALAVAEVLPEGGMVVACDVSKEWTDIGRRYWEQAGVSDKIDLRLGPAGETLDGLISNGMQRSFDFAFIDADKSNYDDYYEKCLVLLRQGGTIAIDNVLWGGRTADPSVTDVDTVALRELNKKISFDERVFSTMLPIGDGLTLAQKL